MFAYIQKTIFCSDKIVILLKNRSAPFNAFVCVKAVNVFMSFPLNQILIFKKFNKIWCPKILLMSNNKSSQQVDEKEIHETVIQARNKYLMIKLRMNPQGDKENNIIRQCEELISILIYGANNETCNNMMTETIENLTEDFQLFFKNEWELFAR